MDDNHPIPAETTPAPGASVPGPQVPRALFVFALLYGGMTCIAGVLGAKQVSLGPLALEAGTGRDQHSPLTA